MTESVRRSLYHGINFFDTAELYGFGEAETLLGHAFKEIGVKREELVVSTKLFWGAGSDQKTVGDHFMHFNDKGINEVGLSRKHIIEGIKASLKRLQLDYVDILYGHR